MAGNNNSLTFFARPTLIIEGKFLFRLSGTVRGKQIADYLGAKFNPKRGYENDTKIFIKPTNLKYVKDGDYVDVLDEQPKSVLRLKDRPGIKVIAMNHPHEEWLKSFLKNEIIIIPHAHVNFENIKRERKEILNCGYIGTNKSYHIRINEEIKKRLNELRLNFTPLFNFTTREDIINYYKTIDVQIIGYFDFVRDCPWYHEKKILDAMSFGIPTIAGYKLAYRDIEKFYIKVNNMDELLAEAKKMKNLEEYNKWPEKLFKKASEYHISEIAKLYQRL